MTNSFIENQNWRYAAKKYDNNKKISTENLAVLKEAIRLAPSSYGLQAYKVIVIENQDIKDKLLAAANNQEMIIDASQIFVFANYTTIDNNLIKQHINNIAQIRNVDAQNLKGYSDFMAMKINTMTDVQRNSWAEKQTYIAMTNLLNCAAELKIDATPMEGFSSEKFNEILGLTALNLNAAVIAVVGYRHQDDANQHNKKARKSNENLFITL